MGAYHGLGNVLGIAVDETTKFPVLMELSIAEEREKQKVKHI